MTTKNYLIVEAGIVTNLVLWDGNLDTWVPPQDSTQLIQENTSAMVWEPVWSLDTKPVITDWTLNEVMGQGGVGFTWNGLVLTTNEPKPV